MDVGNDCNYQCKTLEIGTQKYPLTKTNGGGSYMMCNDDFYAWLKTWLADPPPQYPPAA